MSPDRHFRQEAIPGGHLVIMEADVADGRLRVEDTWQHVYDEDGGEIAGSMIAARTATLNGCLVKDPGYARRLWEEAMRL